MKAVSIALLFFTVGCTSYELSFCPSKTIKPSSLTEVRKACRLWLMDNEYPLLVDNQYMVRGGTENQTVEFTFYPHRDSLEITMTGTGVTDFITVKPLPITSTSQLQRFQATLDTLFIGISE